MQEWLKDKKNLPIVIALSVVVLIGAVVLGLFETGVLPPQPAPSPVAASSAPTVPPGALASLPGAPVLPPAAATPGGRPLGASPLGTVPRQAAAGAKAITPPLNAAKGPDPFKVPGYHPFRVSQAATDALRVRNSLPPIFIQQYTPKDQLVKTTKQGVQTAMPSSLTPEVSASMRMSGVITSDNSIKALLESNGVSTQVQPGDTVNGDKVLSIQPDGLTLRTAGNRLVRVPLSGTPTGGNSPYGGGGGYPGNGPPGLDPNAALQQ